MSSSKAPKTPDYTQAALAQAQSDKEIAQYLTQANRVNQVDPYGQTTWTQAADPEAEAAKKELDYWQNFVSGGTITDGRTRNANDVAWATSHQLKDAQTKYDKLKGNGQWTQTTTLTPEQQQLLNQQQFISKMQNDRIAGLIRDTKDPTAPTLGAQRTLQQYNLAPERDLPDRQLSVAQMAPERQLKEANRNDIQDLLYKQITKQYGDRFMKEEATQRAQLANQGFQSGSEGFSNQLTDFNRERNSAYEDAAVQAALASYDQTNKDRALNQSEFNLLSSNDLNRFGSQTTANLGNFGAQTSYDMDRFTAQSANDLNRFGALNSNELNRFSALSSDDLNRYNSQAGQYNADKGFLAQLLGGVAGPTTPQYQPYAQATPYQSPDLLGAMQGQYQGNLNKANAKNAASNSNMQAGATIAAAAAVAF